MPGRTKKVSEATRCDLLRAAVDLFLERGVARVTLEQIARVAGYTRGAVYHHFRSKSDILEELMESVQLPMEDFFLPKDEQERNDPIGALQRRCTRAMEVLLTDEHRRNIHTILYHRCEFVEELNPIFRKIVDHETGMVAMTEKFFKRARKLGQLKKGTSPSEAAFALYAFATGLHRAALREPWRDKVDVNVSAIMAVFFDGLREK